MSLEAAIEKLTEAVIANTALLQAAIDRAAVNGATKPVPAATVAPSEPAVNPAAAEKRKPGRPPKSKVPSEDDIRTAFGGYLSTKNLTLRDERKVEVRAILQHFGVDKAGEIPAEQRAEALGYIEKLTAGEKPDFMNEDAVEDEDLGEEEESMI